MIASPSYVSLDPMQYGKIPSLFSRIGSVPFEDISKGVSGEVGDGANTSHGFLVLTALPMLLQGLVLLWSIYQFRGKYRHWQRCRGGAIADEASKVLSVIEGLVRGGLLTVVDDVTQATAEEDGDNIARQDRILALKPNLQGHPCVLSAEYLESVSAALVM